MESESASVLSSPGNDQIAVAIAVFCFDEQVLRFPWPAVSIKERPGALDCCLVRGGLFQDIMRAEKVLGEEIARPAIGDF